MLWFSNPRKRTSASLMQVGSDRQIDHVGSHSTANPASTQPESLEIAPPIALHLKEAEEAKQGAVNSGPARDTSHELLESDQSTPEPKNAMENAGQTVPASTQPPVSKPEYRPVARQRCGGVALALGGGVARGWAHIGVLRAVEEFGLPVTMIAGTSIGALVGGSYLAGRLDPLEEFARSLTKTNIVRYLDFSLRGSGLIAGSRLARRMDEQMADITIENLDRPFVAVATEISSGHEVWLSDGPIGPAIRASYALPGVFTPVLHGGRQLVDGALVNPVPVSVCRAYEPDMVIAVNLNAETFGRGTVVRPSHYEAIDDALAHDKNSQAASWFSFMSSKDKTTDRQNRLGVTSVMVESFNIIQDRIARARLAGDPPDFTVRPRLKTVGLIEFHKAAEAIDLGYQGMMSRLNELQEQGILERLYLKSQQIG